MFGKRTKQFTVFLLATMGLAAAPTLPAEVMEVEILQETLCVHQHGYQVRAQQNRRCGGRLPTGNLKGCFLVSYSACPSIGHGLRAFQGTGTPLLC
jgi:hypothetical protein